MQDTEDAGDNILRPDFLTAAGGRLQSLGGSTGSEQALLAQMSRVSPQAN